ncbi:HAMP domain-containing sensor histidine kinase [Azospirillum sp. SYSU D00513]|uniref:sensor histidine kinase n=1 Tax=Azospirillum sp. SYSU D00513 TaxID=2812561 RepID=UPI001A966DD6|nr:HAMP domain-containing sensor histidine kinase [Azospirillum sp. SYSU D00513]
MDLDIRTLFAAHALVSTTLGLLMVAFWRAHRGLPGLGLWTLGTVLLGLALIGVVTRGVLPDLITIVLGNGLGLVGMAAFWNGIRLFGRKPARWKAVLAAIGVVEIAVAYHTYAVNDVPARIVVTSALMSGICLLCVQELLRGPVRRFRTTSATAAFLFGFVGVTLAFRAASVALLPPDAGLFTPTTAQAVHFLVSLISNILIVVALLMMAMQSLKQEVEARSVELEAARSRAEQASRSKSEFLAQLGHELRTPINGVLGFADLIRTEACGPVGDPHYREFAASIHDSGEHLLDLINEVLDHAMVEAGILKLEEDSVDLAATVAFCTGLLAPRADQSGVRIAWSVAPAARIVRADEKRLRQILLNLVSNAVKYTPAGGGVTVTADLDPATGLRILVEDDGIGIEADDLSRVLEPFGRTQRGRARSVEGIGLGLPLTKRLVELHGGRLLLESAPDRGTRVTAVLPAGRVLVPAGMAPGESPARRPADGGDPAARNQDGWSRPVTA